MVRLAKMEAEVIAEPAITPMYDKVVLLRGELDTLRGGAHGLNEARAKVRRLLEQLDEAEYELEEASKRFYRWKAAVALRSRDNEAERVADEYGVTVEDLRGKRRDSVFSVPRQELMLRLRSDHQMSLKEIGAYLGGRHHATVLWGIKAALARRRGRI